MDKKLYRLNDIVIIQLPKRYDGFQPKPFSGKIIEMESYYRKDSEIYTILPDTTTFTRRVLNDWIKPITEKEHIAIILQNS